MLAPTGVCRLRKFEFLTVSSTDNENSPTKLRDAVIGRQKDPPLRVVAEVAQTPEESVELSLVGLVRQALNVLEYEGLRAGFPHDADVLIEQRGIRVTALPLLLKPEP